MNQDDTDLLIREAERHIASYQDKARALRLRADEYDRLILEVSADRDKYQARLGVVTT